MLRPGAPSRVALELAGPDRLTRRRGDRPLPALAGLAAGARDRLAGLSHARWAGRRATCCPGSAGGRRCGPPRSANSPPASTGDNRAVDRGHRHPAARARRGAGRGAGRRAGALVRAALLAEAARDRRCSPLFWLATGLITLGPGRAEAIRRPRRRPRRRLAHPLVIGGRLFDVAMGIGSRFGARSGRRCIAALSSALGLSARRHLADAGALGRSARPADQDRCRRSCST